VHTTSDARLTLLALLACAGAAALARQGEARFTAQQVEVHEPARAPHSGEGDRLRDGEPLDLNRATAAELELLPGVGPRLARDIVQERTRRGGFRSLEALDAVRGIGPKKLAKLRPFLRLEQLEQATEAQRDVGRVE
jgi:competence ComEA-like helix-hairpin-helix protein